MHLKINNEQKNKNMSRVYCVIVPPTLQLTGCNNVSRPTQRDRMTHVGEMYLKAAA